MPTSDQHSDQIVPDFDGAWKTALHTWLPGAMALFWPLVHDAIDWQHPPIYLDKEVRR
jgi:hypothetical protein